MQETYLKTGFVRLTFTQLFWLIVLNVLFIILCIPILSAPASLTALNCACQKLLLDEPGPIRSFFKSFRQNFFSALPLGLAFIAGPVFMIWLCLFYFGASRGKGMLVPLSVFCLVCTYILYCAGAFAFQMLARVKLGTGAILRNSFIMTFQQFRTVIGWLALSFACLTACLFLFPYSFPWLILLGVSLPCFIATRGILPLVDSLIVKE